jgi:hypothetical protein
MMIIMINNNPKITYIYNNKSKYKIKEILIPNKIIQSKFKINNI